MKELIDGCILETHDGVEKWVQHKVHLWRSNKIADDFDRRYRLEGTAVKLDECEHQANAFDISGHNESVRRQCSSQLKMFHVVDWRLRLEMLLPYLPSFSFLPYEKLGILGGETSNMSQRQQFVK